MAWFAVRTRPGGMRLLNRQANPEAAMQHLMEQGLTAVEAELTFHGIEHYLPIELVEITHHRTKKNITIRRPLVPGYVFVEDVRDWSLFERLRWAAGPVRVAQQPAIIPERDIAMIRKAEADIEVVNQQRRAAKSMTAKSLRKQFPSGSKVVVIGQHMLSGREAFVIEATGRRTIKAVLDHLARVSVEIPIEHVQVAE